MLAAHRETACTLKTACGAAETFCICSVLIKPGAIKALWIFIGKEVVSKLLEDFFSGTGIVNR
jgi:hypothetical protein